MSRQAFLRGWKLVVLTCFLAACASKQQAAEQSSEIDTAPSWSESDPFESLNRMAWTLNWEYLDPYFLRPVTVAYTTVMPQFARSGLLNAVNNLYEPRYVLNNLLQGKGEESFDSLSRFVINSTLGLLGTIDVAAKMGIAQQQEDFTEVLGVWGVGPGPFIMAPALGPYDARGVVGDLIDNLYVFPMNLLSTPVNLLRFGVRGIESRSRLMSQEQQLNQSSDSYRFIRDIYIQNMEFRVTDGASANSTIDDEDLMDFEDFERLLEEGADVPNDIL